MELVGLEQGNEKFHSLFVNVSDTWHVGRLHVGRYLLCANNHIFKNQIKLKNHLIKSN